MYTPGRRLGSVKVIREKKSNGRKPRTKTNHVAGLSESRLPAGGITLESHELGRDEAPNDVLPDRLDPTFAPSSWVFL